MLSIEQYRRLTGEGRTLADWNGAISISIRRRWISYRVRSNSTDDPA
ncbi:hypothetical protein [Sphingomonas paucimobilis]|nr:hypothetical protein [Sphingomonas paucimobilis]